MKEQVQSLTPVALYARVSSDRQDVDSVRGCPAAGRCGTTPRVTVTPWSPREYVDEAESGRIADRPPVPQDDRRGR